MTEAIYLEVTEMAETAHKAKRRVSVSYSGSVVKT